MSKKTIFQNVLLNEWIMNIGVHHVCTYLGNSIAHSTSQSGLENF